MSALDDLFPGSSQVRLLGLDRADDVTIWAYAAGHGYGLVTLDTDFRDLAALLGPPPWVVLLRCGNQPTAAVELLLRDHAARIAALATEGDVNCLEIG